LQDFPVKGPLFGSAFLSPENVKVRNERFFGEIFKCEQMILKTKEINEKTCQFDTVGIFFSISF
jgi:hypothetical protein